MPYTFFCPRLHTHSSHNPLLQFSFFFFNDTATTEIYTLSLHDAFRSDRKSTRLNSSHDQISYAVFCLKKKKNGTSKTALQLRNIMLLVASLSAATSKLLITAGINITLLPLHTASVS